MSPTASRVVPTIRDSISAPILPRLARLAGLLILDAFVIWFLNRLASLGYFPLAAAVLFITVFVNIIVFILTKQDYCY